MKEDQTLAVVRSEAGAVAKADPTPAEMFRSIVTMIEGGKVTPETVAAVGKAMELCEHMEKRNAEREFNAAFAKLQGELPVIVAKTIIPNRGKYERFEDVMDAIGKHLTANGFSVSFTQQADDRRITVTCLLRHIGGHSQATPFAVRLGGRADSDTQADCKASTTAKRNSLLQSLNIVIRQDCLNEEDDAGMEGDLTKFVTPAQADELERRAQLVNANIPAFLEFAKAKKFTEIQASRYDELDRMLARKEKGGR